jgi:hypothetical protein
LLCQCIFAGPAMLKIHQGYLHAQSVHDSVVGRKWW